MNMIEGIVVPVKWNENGKVVAIAISTFDEDEYVVSEDGDKVEELFRLLQQQVEVRGKVQRFKKKKVILVTEYTIKKGKKFKQITLKNR